MISLKNLFRRGDRTDVFDLGEKRLAQLKAEGRYSTYRNTRAALRKLSVYRGGIHKNLSTHARHTFATMRSKRISLSCARKVTLDRC